MTRLAVLVALLAASSACKRNLDLPPEPSTAPLSLSPAFVALAPREQATFTATGGAGTYAFGFAQGGRLSGTDATIDPAAGSYQAGSDGSALDVLVVTDAAGDTATASVSVGPRLALSPLSPSASPGGTVTFVPSGGKPPYTFSIPAAGNGSGGTIDEAVGSYTAGALGPAADTIEVTDATGAVASTTVNVGQALQLYRAETRAVAPHESIAFVALGGKPPYSFLIQTAASGAGATMDALSGVYVAGDRPEPDPGTGTVTDVVEVTDSADVPQSATMDVQVGPRLALLPLSRAPHPGESQTLVATGGKPPYAFAFAARLPPGAGNSDPTRSNGGNGGNRSGGEVESATGIYRPGPSPGALDYFQVTDATGAPAAIRQGEPVGAQQLAIGSGMAGCMPSNLNGDQSGDVYFIGRTSGSGFEVAKVVTGMDLASPAPDVQPYYLGAWSRYLASRAVGDFLGTGRDQLLAIGGEYPCTTGWCSRGLWMLAPDLAGTLAAADVPLPVTTYGTPRRGVVRLEDGTATPTWRILADAQPTSGCPTTASPDTDRFMLAMAWPQGDTAPPVSGAQCVLLPSFCPYCGAGIWANAVALAIGDFTGDANLDVAWIAGTVNNDDKTATGANAAVSIAAGDGTATFAAPATGWPGDSWSYERRWEESAEDKFLVARPPLGAGAAKDVLIVRLVDPTGRPRLFALRDPSVDLSTSGFDPNPGGAGVDTIVALDGDTRGDGTRSYFAGWSTIDGTVVGFALDWTTDPPTFVPQPPLASFPFAVSAACFSDVNTDGVRDLVAASDWGATAGIVLGDGADSTSSAGATFGERTHQRGMGWPVAIGDLDGDGFGDAAVAVAGQGLTVLWGGGGQLAWGTQVTESAVGAALVGDFTGDGKRSVFFQEKSGSFGVATSTGDALAPFSVTSGIPGTNPSATGPSNAYVLLWNAALGTTATPGGDAVTMTFGDGSHPVALLRQRYQAVTGGPWLQRVVDLHTPQPTPPASHSTRDSWATAVGLDQPKLAVITSFRASSTDNVDSVAIFGGTVQNPNGVPGATGQPAFSGWTQIAPATLTVGSTPVWSPAGLTNATAAAAGTVTSGPLAGTAIFLFFTDKLYVAEVKVDGAGAFSVSTHAVGPGSAQVAYPFLATLGHLDATSDLHVVAAGGDGLTVLERTGGTTSPAWTLKQRLGIPYFPMGITPLAPGSAGDVVGFLGDFNGVGATPELVPLLGDGTGLLQ